MEVQGYIVTIPNRNQVAVVPSAQSADGKPGYYALECDRVDFGEKKSTYTEKFAKCGAAISAIVANAKLPFAIREYSKKAKDLPKNIKIPGIVTGSLACIGVSVAAVSLSCALGGKITDLLSKQNPAADNERVLSAKALGEPIYIDPDSVISEQSPEEPVSVDCDFGPECNTSENCE